MLAGQSVRCVPQIVPSSNSLDEGGDREMEGKRTQKQNILQNQITELHDPVCAVSQALGTQQTRGKHERAEVKVTDVWSPADRHFRAIVKRSYTHLQRRGT